MSSANLNDFSQSYANKEKLFNMIQYLDSK